MSCQCHSVVMVVAVVMTGAGPDNRTQVNINNPRGCVQAGLALQAERLQ